MPNNTIYRAAGILLILFPVTFPAKAQQAASDTSSKGIVLNEVQIKGIARGSNTAAGVQTPTDGILSTMQGITLIRRGNFAPEVMLHGLSDGQINVTLDGMKIFGACTDHMDPSSSYIEPNNLQSISASLAPGFDAMGSSIGGGVNFRLKQPELDAARPWSGIIGGTYQSNGNGIQTLASLQYSGKRFAVLADGLYRASQDYTAGGGEKMPFSQYHKWNGNIGTRYALGNHSLLTAQYLQDEGRDIGFPALTMDVKYARAKIASISYSYDNRDVRLYHWETKLYGNFIDHAMDDTKRPADQVAMHMDMPGHSRTAGFYAEARYAAGKKNDIKLRLETYRNNMHAAMTMYPESAPSMFMLTMPDAQRNVAGMDLADRITLDNNWVAEGGIRLEYNSSRITTEEGRAQISGIYQGNPDRNNFLWNAYATITGNLSDYFTINGNIAKGMRNSTLREYYGVYLYNRLDGYDYWGNPALKNEQSFNVSIAAKYHHGILRVEGNIFSNLIQNYIGGVVLAGYPSMTSGGKGIKQYENISSARIYGGGLKGSVQITPRFVFVSSNSYSRGTDANSNALPLIAPFTSVNSLQYYYRHWALNVESASQAAQHHVSAVYGEQDSPFFTLLNAGITKHFAFKNNQLECRLKVDNILDRNYYEHLDIYNIPRPGRSFIAQVTFLF